MQRPEISFQIDLDEEAALLLSSATGAVRKILDRRRALDADGQYDTPLVVILGEAHDNPAHHAHHMLVLDGLKDWQRAERFPGTAPLILCHELEHTSLKQAFGHITGVKPTAESGALLTAADPLGKMNAKTYLGFFALFQSDFSKATLLRTTQDSGILNFFTDCDKDEGRLSTSDPETAQAIAANGCDTKTPIDAISEEGVRIRNDHMARKALHHARDCRARIVFQQCGNAHVVGLDDLHTGTEIYKAKDSLSAAFKKLGASVLAMPQTGSALETMDVSAHHALGDEEFFAVEKLPAHSTAYNPFTNQALPGAEDGAFTSRAHEAAYLTALLDRAGIGHAALSLSDYFQKRMEDCAGLQQFCAAMTPKVTARAPALAA